MRGRRLLNVPLLYLSKYNPIFLNLVSVNPFHASIKITENCNSRCIMCNAWKNRYLDELTTTEIEDILYQSKEVGIKSILFTGGEPLLRKDIGELIEKTKKLKLKAYLQTNGLILNKKAETLIESGINRVIISIDGIGKNNDEIRGVPGGYNKAIKGIYALKNCVAKEKVCDLEIAITTTLTSINNPEIPQLIELCKKLKVKWGFNLLDTNPYFFQNVDISKLLITDKDLVDRTIDYLYRVRKETPEVFNMEPVSLEFARKYLKNENPHVPCVLGYLMVYIDSHANLYSGCWVLSPLGNLKKEKLVDILNSEKYKQRLLKMFNLKCPGCSCAYDRNCKINNLPLSAKGMIKKYRGLI